MTPYFPPKQPTTSASDQVLSDFPELELILIDNLNHPADNLIDLEELNTFFRHQALSA